MITNLENYAKKYYSNNMISEITHTKNYEATALKRNILNIYNKVKYNCLDSLSRPYIFAYSALVNDQIE